MNGFGQRADEEGCLGRRRLTAGAGAAKAAQVHDLVALDDGKGYSRDAQAAHLTFDVSVDCIVGALLEPVLPEQVANARVNAGR